MENRVEFEMCGHKFVFGIKDVREEEKWGRGCWRYVFKVRMRVDGKPFQTFEFTGSQYEHDKGKNTLEERDYKTVLECLISDMMFYLNEDYKPCRSNAEKLLSRLSEDEWYGIFGKLNEYQSVIHKCVP